jgi:biopolymer transport protein ExbD
MSFGSFDSGHSAPMADINTTPLVDVMLVLLIIFIVTAPLMSRAIRVDVPQAAAPTTTVKPSEVRLAVAADGSLRWNDAAIDEAALHARLADAARSNPPTVIQLAADRETRYQRLAELLAAARSAGVTRLGFVTRPLP